MKYTWLVLGGNNPKAHFVDGEVDLSLFIPQTLTSLGITLYIPDLNKSDDTLVKTLCGKKPKRIVQTGKRKEIGGVLIENSQIIGAIKKGLINRNQLQRVLQKVVREDIQRVYRLHITFPSGYCKCCQRVLDNLPFISAWNSYNSIDIVDLDILKLIFDFEEE